MWKDLFPFAVKPTEAVHVDAGRDNAAERVVQPAEEPQKTAEKKLSSFEEIYQGSPCRSSKVAYTILKVAEMAESPHLDGLSGEAKRCSLLMALETAGVEVEDLLQDAMVRQRLLNDYEDAQQVKLKEFETAKIEENRKVQAELDRITAQYMNRIQDNLDQVAHQQDVLRAWQKQKQYESRRISDAAAICVPKNSPTNGDSLTLVLERVASPRR